MEIFVFMIVISLGLSISFVAAFWWANRGHQFDDLVTPAIRAVYDETDKGDKHGEV